MKKYCIILLSFLTLPGFSTEYFVSNSGVNSNSGTINSPFKTITYAVSKIKGGDIVYVRSGIYNEQVILYKLPNTTISAYNKETVIIDGTGIDPGDGSGLVRSFSQYTQFIGLTVRNSVQYGITLDQNNAAHSVISGCTVYNCTKSGIGEWADYCTVKDCVVYNVTLDNTGGVMSVGWGCGISCHGSSSIHLTGNLIKHNIVHDIWGEGIIVAWAINCIVEDNTVYDNFSVGIYNRNSHNTLNQRNFVYTTKVMNKGSQVGLGHWNEDPAFVNQGNIFQNNIVSGCKRNIRCSWDTDGLRVINNTFVNSTYSAGVEIEDKLTNSLFANNIVVQEGNLPCISNAAGSGMVFLNNLYNKAHSNSTGAGDITGDPGFAGGNITTPDYFKLSSNSPAINKGTSGVTDDYFGNLRDIPDIGAVEYMFATGTPPVVISSFKAVILHGQLQMTFTEPKGRVTIYTSSGWPIMTKNINSTTLNIDVSRYRKGIYLVSYTNLKTETVKIVV